MDFESVVDGDEFAGKLDLLDRRVCGDQYVGRLSDISKHVGFIEEIRRPAAGREGANGALF